MNKTKFHFKKDKSIEMKFYELLGIKAFRKMAFFVRDIVTLPLTFKMPKEERKKSLYNTASNYNIGKAKSLEDIKKFKKQLFKNAGIHIFALLAFLPSFIKIIMGMASLSTTIIVLPIMVMNIYCIMLQRYNCIRINQLIEKMTPRYEKQKDAIKEELIEKDSLLLEHSYKIIDKKEKETSINFEDLIANASIEELKQYRNYLDYLKIVNRVIQVSDFCPDKEEIDMSMAIEKDKTLKFEFKNQNSTISISDR